jgi:transposase
VDVRTVGADVTARAWLSTEEDARLTALLPPPRNHRPASLLSRPWTSEELAYLREHYDSDGYESVAKALGRTTAAILNRASKIGVARARWTDEERARLKILFGTVPVTELAATLRRTKRAIRDMANDLGIRAADIRQGFELINAAARRLGVWPMTMQRIIRWSHIQWHRPLMFDDHPTSHWAHRLYETADIDAAFERWSRLETLQQASRRTGWSATSLRGWLLEAGVSAHKTGRQKQALWRVEPADVDRVVAEHMSTDTIRSAAARAGVSVQTMDRWLRSAGVVTGRRAGTPHRLDRVVVDRVIETRRRESESLSAASARTGIPYRTLLKRLREAGYVSGQRGRYHRFDQSVVDAVVMATR